MDLANFYPRNVFANQNTLAVATKRKKATKLIY